MLKVDPRRGLCKVDVLLEITIYSFRFICFLLVSAINVVQLIIYYNSGPKSVLGG